MKICSRCNEQKTLALYPKAPTCVDGHRSYCKACDKARKNIWRASNKTAHNEKSRKWARANPEKRKAVQDTYNAMYRASGRALEAARAWRKNNAPKSRASTNARRARMREATPPWANMDEIRRIYEAAAAADMTVDHIVPLRHALVCGLHVANNLQVISAKENYEKSNLFNNTRSR